MMYYTLAAATLAVASSSAVAPVQYVDYVADDTRPVCGKHYEQDRNRLCNLFLSCYPEVFNSGVTGFKHCPEACAKLTDFFPREVCKADHWMEQIAYKFETDEDNMQVCYTQNDSIGRKCVDVNSFVDIPGVPQELCIQMTPDRSFGWWGSGSRSIWDLFSADGVAGTIVHENRNVQNSNYRACVEIPAGQQITRMEVRAQGSDGLAVKDVNLLYPDGSRQYFVSQVTTGEWVSRIGIDGNNDMPWGMETYSTRCANSARCELVPRD